MNRRAALADLRAALPGWIVARVLVLLAWVGSRWWIEQRRSGVRPIASTQGLFAWDGAFYRGLAEHGYRLESAEALRFLPLYPLVGRWLHTIFAISVSAALLLVTEVAALAAAAMVHRLTKAELGDGGAARRAAWYLALVPPGFVLTWAYAEALFIVLAVGTFMLLRREKWWWAAAAGFLTALARPTGVFLVAAALVEAGRGIRARRVGELGPRAAAVAGPVAGLFAYLWWVQHVFGSWHSPVDLQNALRGGTHNPIIRVGEAMSDLAHLDIDGLHFFFAIALIVLTVIVWQRLPLSYGVFTAAVVVTTLSAGNLNSMERYGLNAFPVVMALACVTSTPRAERITTLTCAAGLTWMCALAWLGEYVP